MVNPPSATHSVPQHVPTQSMGTRGLSLPLLVLVAAMLGGCVRDGHERAIVSGTVTYQGQPVEEGRIRFLPAKGTKAPVSGAAIINGKYSADARGGVPVGTHNIRITARRIEAKYAELGDSLPRDLQDVGELPMQQYIPEKYNVKTELEITVPPGSGKIIKDFDLTEAGP